MPSSPWSPTGVLTIVSLVSLCFLSFIVVLGSDNVVNNHVRDTVYLFPKRDTPHHRRAFHHGRAPVPRASAPAASNAPQQNTPAATATPVEPSSPQQTPSSPDTQPANQPTPSPSPSPSSTPQSQSQPAAQSSSPPSAPSSATPSSSTTPAAALSTSSPNSGPATTSNAPASLSHVSSSQINSVSNIANPSATSNSNSFQPGGITALGGTTTGPDSFPSIAGSTSTVLADPTAGATSKGFFANKAGVGVTFAIVGIIGGLALIFGVRTVLRRYRDSREAREVDEWFDKYSTGHGSSSWHGDGQYARDDDQYANSRNDGQYAGSNHDDGQYGGSGYAASATDVAATAAMTPAAPDAYPDRSIHYGQQNSDGVVPPSSVNPAGAGGAPHSRKPSHSNLRYSVTASQVGHPYATSVNPAAYAAAAPSLPPIPHVPYPPMAHGQEQMDAAANGDPFYRSNPTDAGIIHTGYAQ